MVPEVIITADGSNSLYHRELDEHYHSIHGAIQESQHVFINAGLNEFKNSNDSIHILEVGFGTGLNALLTLMHTTALQTVVYYTSLETHPLSVEQVAELNYLNQLDASEYRDTFARMHSCDWNKSIDITAKFNLKKLNKKVQEKMEFDKYNLIYFDAFGPRVQPELWEIPIFENMYKALCPGGILVTYCAKGQVKRNMKAVGFEVEALPGPPGKREMTRARKIIS